MITPAVLSSTAEQRFLAEWLARGARRMRTRDALRDAGWVLFGLLTCAGMYLLGQRLHVPSTVLAALLPLLLLGIAVAVGWLVWRCKRRLGLDAAATEADARGGLNDELTSAWWFAQQATSSPWEACMLSRATDTARALDPRRTFPLRLPGSLAAAALLGAAVVALTAVSHGTFAPTGVDAAFAGGNKVARADAGATATTLGFAAIAAASAAKANELWTRAEALARSLQSSEEQAGLERAIRTGDVNRVRELVERAEQEGRVASAGADARVRAGQMSPDGAQSLLDRLEAMLADGSEPKEADAGSMDEDGGKQQKAPNDPTERRDAEQDTTMDALNDALSALGQAASGNHPTASSSPPDPGSQSNGRVNISGGAEGLRVNVTAAGEGGGEDTPPDAPAENPRGSAEGKPTVRLAARPQRLDNAAPEGNSNTLSGEGTYAATQAQTARVGLSTVHTARSGASEATIAREHIPVAYRASVKRYFLTEHGKEP